MVDLIEDYPSLSLVMCGLCDLSMQNEARRAKRIDYLFGKSKGTTVGSLGVANARARHELRGSVGYCPQDWLVLARRSRRHFHRTVHLRYAGLLNPIFLHQGAPVT